MTKSLIIYGGGMAGAKLAKLFADQAEVTLVSPLDYFEVPMALPRLLVQPDFVDQATVPLPAEPGKIRYVQGHLVGFDGETGRVLRADGEEVHLNGDVTVLATGSRYGSDLIRAHKGTLQERRAEFADFRAELDQARDVVIVGAGPVGVELAGEITEDFTGKTVHLLNGSDEILKGTSRKVATYARKTLEARGVQFHLGQRLTDSTPEDGHVTTDQGVKLPADLVVLATGGRPNTGFMSADSLAANGCIPVDDHLSMKGSENTFVAGDIADLNEVKKAIYVNGHVKTLKKNIFAVLAGKTPKARYKAQTGNDIMVVTLGRRGGVARIPGLGMVKTGWLIRMVKAGDMLTGMYRKAVGGKK